MRVCDAISRRKIVKSVGKKRVRKIHLVDSKVKPPPPKTIKSLLFSEIQLLTSGYKWLSLVMLEGRSWMNLADTWARRPNGTLKVGGDKFVLSSMMKGSIELKSMMPGIIANIATSVRYLSLVQLLVLRKRFAEQGYKEGSSTEHLKTFVDSVDIAICETIVAFLFSPFLRNKSKTTDIMANGTKGEATAFNPYECGIKADNFYESGVNDTISAQEAVDCQKEFARYFGDEQLKCVPTVSSLPMAKRFTPAEIRLIGRRILFILGYMMHFKLPQHRCPYDNSVEYMYEEWWWYVSAKSKKTDLDAHGIFFTYPTLEGSLERPEGRILYGLNSVQPPMIMKGPKDPISWDAYELHPEGELQRLEPRMWGEVLAELNESLRTRRGRG